MKESILVLFLALENVFKTLSLSMNSQVAQVLKNPPTNAGDTGNMGLIPGSRKSPGVGNDNPLQYVCLGKFHGQRSLAGYSPWDSMDYAESDMAEHACNNSEFSYEFFIYGFAYAEVISFYS